MRLIVLNAVLAAVLLVPGAAAAQDPELLRIKYQATSKTSAPVSTVRILKLTAFKPPPIKLPSIAALTKFMSRADRPVLEKQQRRSQRVLRFWEGKGEWIRAPRHRKCWEVPWQRSCTIARHSFRLHNELHTTAKERLWLLSRTLPAPNDWRSAVRVVQRVYPGTEGWLLSCSASEGSHGRWVSNHQGSGAGGWLQFMESTFWRMYGAALTEARAEGFIVPHSANSWYSPLGQALAGAWGVTNGRSSEWYGGGC